MPNLKDTDFDDLFRRASDKYPLRTDSSDWDRMAAALEKDPSPDTSDGLDDTDRRRRRRFFWWFLLLPLAGIGYYTIHQSGRSGQGTANAVSVTSTPANNAAVTKPAAAGAAVVDNAGKDGSTASNATDNNAAAKNAAANNASNTTGATKNAAKGGATKTSPNSGATAQNTRNNTAPAPSTGLAGAGMPRLAHRMVNSNDPKNSRKGIRATEGDVPVRPQTAGNAPARPQTSSDNRFSEDQSAAQIDPLTNPIAAAFTLRNSPINEQRARLTGPYALNVAVKAKEIKKDSPKQKAKRESYLYAGIIAAPDLSTVKFQKATGVGNTFGLLFGYAFNKHWAIETGAYLDRKRYYSDGEYFSTKKIYLQPNTYIQNVDGTCYMWEIPLNVRYMLNPDGKTRWFATAGLSTYLMNREKYTAALENPTNSWTGYWDRKTPSQYPFSILGFSVGFEQRLGNVGNLRIEPYVKVPLSGIGTGSLPILSTGINIGITRTLWKK